MAKRRPIFYKGQLARYFRDLRERHGWSLRHVVSVAEQKRLQVSLGALKWLEGGFTKNPEPELLRGLSELYGEPYGTMVQEVAKHVFAIELDELLQGTTSPTSTEGVVTLPLLARPITAGQHLLVTSDSEHDGSLAFNRDFVKRFTRPICLRVGGKEAAMTPTIAPGDVVVIDQNLTRRRHPLNNGIYAINAGPVIGDGVGALQRVELSGRTLILSSDNPDKSSYPTRAFDVKGANLPDVLAGEVVWFGRYVGSGRK